VYKPVYAAAQPQPTTQRVIQRPQTLDEKILKTKEAIDYEANRIYYCSYLFIAFGLVSIFMGFKEMFDARLKAAFIVQEKQIPWGNSNYTGFQWLNVTTPSDTRVETILYDTLWNMSLLTVIVSFFLFAMGRAALRATQKQKSRVAERMFNRHFFMFLAFLVFYVFTRKQGRIFKGTFDYIKQQANETNQTTIFDNTTMVSNMTQEMPKRNLRASHGDFEKFNKVMQKHEEMFDQMDMQFDNAFNQEIPEDFRNVMTNMKKHQQ